MRNKANSRIFYGWWIVAACIVVTMLHAGAAFYAFGRFLPTLIEEFGSGTTVIAGAVSIYMLVVGLTGPVAGKLTDKYGPKKLIVIGAVIAAIGFMFLGLASAVWHIYICYFVVGIGMSGAGFVPVSVAISNWFVRRRGVAMGIAMAGVSLGAIVIAPLAHYLIVVTGWQMAFVILGVLTAVLIIIPVMFVMRTRPEDVGLLPDGARPVEAKAMLEMASVPDSPDPRGNSSAVDESWTLSRAFRSLPFWLLLVTFFFTGAVVAGVLQHEVNFLKNMGIPMATASFALGLTGGIGGLGKVVFGFLADKFNPKYASVLCIALQVVGLAILIMTQNMALVWAFVVVYGFAMGGWLTLEPLVTGQLFGMASFGAIFGWVLAAAAVGSALGPFLMGAIFDASGSYSIGFITFLVVYGVAIAALSFARRPKLA